jgi:hypothetical protein
MTRFAAIALVWAFGAVSAPVGAAESGVLTVTTDADAGPGSLRAAVEAANETPTTTASCSPSRGTDRS